MYNVPDSLKNNGVVKIRFYNLNVQPIGPVATVCIFIGENKQILARGVSVCSLRDNFNTLNGMKTARKRATKAIFTKENSDEININRDSLVKHVARKQKVYKTKTFKDYISEYVFDFVKISAVEDHKNCKKYIYSIPMFVPLYCTSKMLESTYKSTFKPPCNQFEEKEFLS